ncbi:MAG: response regulator [Roseibium sp.]|nr:response regulator [Roseibium sp.]
MTTRILLVEDEPALLDLYSSTLEAEGYAVKAFKLLSAAQEALSADLEYDLAILDFWVGKESTLEFSKVLRMRQPDIPIIFMSGGADELSLEMTSALAEADGATEFLFKPFKMDAFLATVSTVLPSS